MSEFRGCAAATQRYISVDVPQQHNVTFQGCAGATKRHIPEDMLQQHNATFQGMRRGNRSSHSRGYAAATDRHIPGDMPQQQIVTFQGMCRNNTTSHSRGCAAATRHIPSLIQRQHVKDRFICYYFNISKELGFSGTRHHMPQRPHTIIFGQLGH